MGRKLDILVVDDQPGVRYLLDIVFREGGHNVRLAQNGLQAIDAVKAQKPDLVIMDVRMPQMNGLEALGRIKLISPETEVILMTAYITDETIQSAIRKGALCCFNKPFDIEECRNFIEEYCWRKESKKEASHHRVG